MRTLLHLSDTHIQPAESDRLVGADTLANLRAALGAVVVGARDLGRPGQFGVAGGALGARSMGSCERPDRGPVLGNRTAAVRQVCSTLTS
jgi:hypothetical protein